MSEMLEQAALNKGKGSKPNAAEAFSEKR